jgi:ketosteroid isomerase-like protein
MSPTTAEIRVDENELRELEGSFGGQLVRPADPAYEDQRKIWNGSIRLYRGHAELRRYADELFESFSEVRPEDVEFRDFGNRVLCLYRLSVRGRDSGVEIEQPGGIIFELRGGKIVHGRSYLSHRQAFEAAGLSDQDVHADPT